METQNEVTSETLATLATTAATVAAEHSAFATAVDTQNAAEAALLELIIDTVKPALRALGSRIVKLDRSTSGRNGCNPVEEKDYFDERGVCLVDAFSRQKDATGNEGSFGGSRLYLLTDGRLAEVDREGTWSQWQGAWSGYEATLTIVDAATAQRHYELADMIEALNTKLAEQLKGEKAKRTKAAQARASKLAAVASLMGVPNAS